MAVDELTGLLSGQVNVGMLTSCSSVDVPDLLADFHHAHPAVDIRLSEANSEDLLARLRTGQLDLALVGLATTPTAGIRTHQVADEPLVTAVPHDDPLAGRDTVTLAALCQRPLISLPPGTALRAALDQGCAEAGLVPHIVFEATAPTLLARLAARGLGVAILPRVFLDDSLHTARILRPQLHGRLELAWRDGPLSPAARALLQHARQRVVQAGRR